MKAESPWICLNWSWLTLKSAISLPWMYSASKPLEFRVAAGNTASALCDILSSLSAAPPTYSVLMLFEDKSRYWIQLHSRVKLLPSFDMLQFLSVRFVTVAGTKSEFCFATELRSML